MVSVAYLLNASVVQGSLAASLGYPPGSVTILTVGSTAISPQYARRRAAAADGRRRASVAVTFQVADGPIYLWPI